MAEQTGERRATVTGFTSAHPGYEAGYLAAEAARPTEFDWGHAWHVGIPQELHGEERYIYADLFAIGWQAWCEEQGLPERERGR